MGLQQVQYLLESLQQDYNLAIAWSGALFCGITLTWYYTKQTVNLSMPAYIANAITKFQHPLPVQTQHLQHKHNPIKYGVQVPLPKDTTPLLSVAQCKHVQETVSTLLHYSHAMDSTLACASSSIAARQTNGTISVFDACHQLLDYVAMHSHAAICYHAKNDISCALDASYLSEPDSKSHIGGHYFLTNQDSNASNNGTIITLVAIIRHVVSSESEAEIEALFNNCKNVMQLW